MADRNAPLYFIDDNPYSHKWSDFGKYGWNFENTAGNSSPFERLAIHSVKTTGRCALTRHFEKLTDCTLTIETNLVFNSVSDGFAAILCSGDDEKEIALKLVTKDSHLWIVEDKEPSDTGVKINQGSVAIKAVCNLSAGKTELYVDGKYIGVFKNAEENVHTVDYFVFRNEPSELVDVIVGKTAIHTGYYLNEMFISSADGKELPDIWTFATDGKSEAIIAENKSSAYDPYGADLKMKVGTSNKLSANFEKTSGKVCFEMRFLMDEYIDGTKFGFCGNNEVYVITNGDAYYTPDGTFLRKYNKTVWQTVRIDVNPDTGVVVYSINDKKYATKTTDCKYFNSIYISSSPKADVTMHIDDLWVFNMFDEEADYVPEPVPVKSKGYNIGAEVCDIWRNGFQFGWDYTSGFEDLDCYLGKFDEGLTEPADWEIKWMVEHGIDFRLVCWYGCQPSSPQKMPRNTWGQKAYMDAKYTDMLKFAIQWEDTYNMPTCSEDFRKYVVPYWVEYYLTDDRYYTIDNKPLICVFRTPTLVKAFGSEEGVKAEFDYLRDVCRGLGFDGAIILCCAIRNGDDCKRMGIDGVYGYNWGPAARDPQIQKNYLETYCGTDNYITVPTVGVGFNTISLYDNKRSDLITPQDYESLLYWVRDEYLPNRNVKEDWLKKTVILSNWNEFGEGHFIMPSKLHGFGYVDALRKVFTDNTPHNDVRPDRYARRRFNSLYNQDYRRMRRLGYVNEKLELDDFVSVRTFDFSDKETQNSWSFCETILEPERTEISMKGKCLGSNFWIENKQLDIDADEINSFYVIAKFENKAHIPYDGKLFFITENETAWNEDKCAKYDADTFGDFVMFAGTFSKCYKWKGKITGLRLDPIKTPVEFEIKTLSLGRASGIDVYAGKDKNHVSFELLPKIMENGKLSIVLNTTNPLIAYLSAYAEWDSKLSRYTIRNAEHSLVYTIGEHLAILDGKEIDLGYKSELFDGVLKIYLDDLQLLGYKVETDGNGKFYVE